MLTATLLLGGFLIGANLVAMTPLVPFIVADIGHPESAGIEMAMLLGSFPIVSFMCNLLLAAVIDRFAQHKLMFCGALGCAGAFGGAAVSPGVLGVILARAAVGVFMPMIAITLFAVIAGSFDQKSRFLLVGYVTAALNLGGATLTPLAVAISTIVSWRLVLLSIGLMCGVFSWLCYRHIAPRPTDSPSSGTRSGDVRPGLSFDACVRLLARRPILQLLSGYFVLTAGAWIFVGLYPTWLIEVARGNQWSVGAVSLVLFIGGLGSAAGASASGMFAASAHKLRMVALMLAAGAIATMLVPRWGTVVEAQALLYCAVMFVMMNPPPYLRSLAMELIGETGKAFINAVLNCTYQSASVVGVFLGSAFYVLDSGFTWNTTASASILAVGALLVGSLHRAASIPR